MASADNNPNAQITKLWRIRKTVATMLDDRGYVVATNFQNETRQQFEAAWQSAVQE